MALVLLINFKLSQTWYSHYLHAENAIKPTDSSGYRTGHWC